MAKDSERYLTQADLEYGGSFALDLENLTNAQAYYIRETAGPTKLTVGNITDGDFVKRSGTTFVSGTVDISDNTNLAVTAPITLTGDDVGLSYNAVDFKVVGGELQLTGSGSTTAEFVTLALDAGLSAERVLTGTANQIVITDNGANSTVVLSLPQDIDTAADLELGTLTITGVINAGVDTDKFLVLDSGDVVDFRTGAEVLSDIGASPTSHLHDGDTLQNDGVNSDGGAFSFSTTGDVSFNQNLIIPNSGNIGPVGQSDLLELASNSAIVNGTSYLHIIGKVISNTVDHRAMFMGYRARVGPAAVESGDYLVSFIGRGYDGNDYETAQMVEMKTTQDWTPTAHGASMTFYTTPDDSVTSTERITIRCDGNVGFGNQTPVSKLEIYDATFSGQYGSFADERASLLVSGKNPYHSVQISSTYNSGTYPNYGLVLVNGSNTTDYDIWGIMHDGPARADGGLKIAYLHGTGSGDNIHTTTPMVTFQKDGNVKMSGAVTMDDLYLYDTNASHTLLFHWNEDEAGANRTLNWVMGGADRTITLSGDPTLDDWFDQSVKIAATPTHVAMIFSGLINAGTDTDKFLVLDGAGNVDYRTGGEVLEDINAEPIFNGLVDPSQYTFSYDPATRQATITNAGTDVIVTGTRVTPDNETTAAHADTTGPYYFYYTSGNTTLTVNTTPWDILTQHPIGFVYYNTDMAANSAIQLYEQHSIEWHQEHHMTEHFFHGTKYISGQDLADYTLQPGGPADADNQFSVSAGMIADEDIDWTVTALASAGPYTIFFRNGADAANRWDWDDTITVPLLDGGSYLYYNQNLAGTWQQTALANNNYTNLWIISVMNGGDTKDVFLVQGQEAHSTLAGALLESFNVDIDWGVNIPFTEFCPDYMITFKTGAAYGSTGKCRIEYVTDLRGIVKGGAAVVGTPTSHNTLSNRDAANSHPASAIDTDVTNFAGSLSAADLAVQLALDTLDDHLHDTQTLQMDNINSNGGAFAFSTTGPVTYNQNQIISKADPEHRLTDTGDSEYTRVTRSDTDALAQRRNRVLTPGSVATAFDDSANFTQFFSFAQDLSCRCVIPASYLSNDGAQVRVRFKAHNTVNTVIGAAYIGTTEADDRNCANYTQLLFSGIAGATIPAGTTLWSDWLTFSFDATIPHSISFFLENPESRCYVPVGTHADDKAYHKAGSDITADPTWSDDAPGNFAYWLTTDKIESGFGTGDEEAVVWKSQDGVFDNEKGIQTYGDPDGRHVIEGKTIRFNIGGVEIGDIDASGEATLNFANTGLHILDTDASHDLIMKWNENEAAADRTLNIIMGGADRTLDMTTIGTGDVIGPAGATDHAVVRYDTATGKLLQDSVVIITDAGNMSGIGTLDCGAITSSGISIFGGGSVNDWDAAYDAMQFSDENAIAWTAGSMEFTQNAYYDDTDNRWEYVTADQASRYFQSDGTHYFLNGVSGNPDDPITWVNLMKIGSTVTGVNMIGFPDNLADAFSFENANGDVFQKFISTTGALAVEFGQNIGIGVTPAAGVELDVLTTYTAGDAFAIYGKAATSNANDNYGVFANAVNAGAGTAFPFKDNHGNYSDASEWVDISDPSRKALIREPDQDEMNTWFDNYLDNMHLHGYRLLDECIVAFDEENLTENEVGEYVPTPIYGDPNNAREKFGFLANDLDLPAFIPGIDRKGVGARSVSAFNTGCLQVAKKRINELEQRLSVLENT